MTLPAPVTCPGCGSRVCRKSSWRSAAERQTHPGLRPYRCRACHHRFWGPDPRRSDRRLALGVVVLPLLIVGIAMLVTIDEQPDDEIPLPPSSAAPVPIDPYTLRAAQEGDADAQLRIAKTILLGGGHNDGQLAEAVRWLQSAAENGSAAAMVHLGRLYRSGFGVLQDYELAKKWIRTAAERGDAEGMLELGRLHRDGVGFARDPVRAYVWFNRAAAALHVEAVRDRDDVARGLTAEQLKEAQAQSSSLDAPLAQDNRR